MSASQVPSVYREIINKTISSVRPEFEEMGLDDAILAELQRSWEYKVATSRVADFTTDPGMEPHARAFPPLDPRAPRPSAVAAVGAAAATGAETKDGETGDAIASTSTASTSKPSKSSKKQKKEDEAAKKKAEEDEDAINSDLDDSDDEDADGGVDGPDGGKDGDLVIALYDKVQRVKNKWKVTLKDGVISANGRDYLFSKCNGQWEQRVRMVMLFY